MNRPDTNKLLVWLLALVMTFTLTACGGEDVPEDRGAALGQNPAAGSTGDAAWPHENVTKEQLQAIAEVMAELEPWYNQAVILAQQNGWDADETTLKELNGIDAFMDMAKLGAEDPSQWGDSDMDAAVEVYRTLLEAIPDLVAKVSEPYGQ